MGECNIIIKANWFPLCSAHEIPGASDSEDCLFSSDQQPSCLSRSGAGPMLAERIEPPVSEKMSTSVPDTEKSIAKIWFDCKAAAANYFKIHNLAFKNMAKDGEMIVQEDGNWKLRKADICPKRVYATCLDDSSVDKRKMSVHESNMRRAKTKNKEDENDISLKQNDRSNSDGAKEKENERSGNNGKKKSANNKTKESRKQEDFDDTSGVKETESDSTPRKRQRKNPSPTPAGPSKVGKEKDDNENNSTQLWEKFKLELLQKFEKNIEVKVICGYLFGYLGFMPQDHVVQGGITYLYNYLYIHIKQLLI